MQTSLHSCFMQGPLGRLMLVASEQGLTGVYFESHRHMRSFEAREVRSHPVLDSARRELGEYFAGTRCYFETALAPHTERGGTAFQAAVWEALATIPWGTTWSYGELSRSLGRPSAARAVGAANARNPLSIFVPCHRVVGASGSLTGYAGGMDWKRWLLAHEQKAASAGVAMATCPGANRARVGAR